ncbi:MAG: biosynthetic arginine decarboxylase [Phycisphaerales bacterium]|nr:biosynthetic arginine decarboxylase [Phycisphaerales bacterium]
MTQTARPTSRPAAVPQPKPKPTPVKQAHVDGWSPAESASLYRVSDWSAGYFAVNEKGHLAATPTGEGGPTLDLLDVVEGLRERNITAPVLLRFTDILADRLRKLRDAFANAMKENGYSGKYLAVYPIKVNQQHQVVAELSEFGHALGFGLEVGSKPELLAVMALTTDTPDQLIICNGFKDARYIEAVILSTKLGRQIIPVVENMDEVRLIIDYARRYKVRPRIGVRVKLAAAGAGRWHDSSGARSKFGLTVSELLEMVSLLREHGMLDCLKLLHCHSGSQVQDIQRVKDVITELAHVYVELANQGAALEMLDIGGGLGVDYKGDQSNSFSSMNYTIEEFASDVVYRIGSVCDAYDMKHPTLITECGRAMVAYSSVLVFNVLGSTGPNKFDRAPSSIEAAVLTQDKDEIPQPILDLQGAFDSVHPDRLLECYHDAQKARDEAMTLFRLGYLTLPQRAVAERLFWTTCLGIRDVRDKHAVELEELDELDVILSDVYFCNFSLFQSLPDHWAIDQLFPIMPIHRLEEEPTRRAVLADITCDSDGKIDQFIGDGETPATLQLHPLTGQDYFLGVFLVGAYQETLGDLHNLFGDAHAVHIRLEDGVPAIEEIVKGDTVGEVLAYVQYDPPRFTTQLARDCERAVRAGVLTVQERQVLIDFYESGLASYTYLESAHRPGAAEINRS